MNFDNLHIHEHENIEDYGVFKEEDFITYGTVELYEHYIKGKESFLEQLRLLKIETRNLKIKRAKQLKKGLSTVKIDEKIRTAEKKIANKENKVVNKSKYLDILRDFNTSMLNELMTGKVFIIGHRLGVLRVICRKHNPNKKRINYHATKQLNTPVYYTDKYYLDFNWMKKFCTANNKTVYRFTASYSDTHKNCAKDILKAEMKKQEFYKFKML